MILKHKDLQPDTKTRKTYNLILQHEHLQSDPIAQAPTVPVKFGLPAYYTSILKPRRRSSPRLMHVSCNGETVSNFLEDLLSVTREIRQVDYADVTLWRGTHTQKRTKKQVDELWPTTRTQTNYPPAINKLLCPAFTSLHRS